MLTGHKCETFNPGCNFLKNFTYRKFNYEQDQIIQHKIKGDPICYFRTKGTRKIYNKAEKGLGHSLNNFLIKIGAEAYAKEPLP
jgi:hypothetical protein